MSRAISSCLGVRAVSGADLTGGAGLIAGLSATAKATPSSTVIARRASVEQSRRTATVRAVTDCRVVSYLAADLPVRDLRELAAGHYRGGR